MCLPLPNERNSSWEFEFICSIYLLQGARIRIPPVFDIFNILYKVLHDHNRLHNRFIYFILAHRKGGSNFTLLWIQFSPIVLNLNKKCCNFSVELLDRPLAEYMFTLFMIKFRKKILDWTKIITVTCSRYRHPCMQPTLGIRPDTVSSPSTGRLHHTQVLRLKIKRVNQIHRYVSLNLLGLGI